MKNYSLLFLLSLFIVFSNCSGPVQKSKAKDESINEESNTPESLAFDYNGSQEKERKARARIDSVCEAEIAKTNTPIHYSLKKMNAVFKVIPKLYDEHYLQDFWLSQYLKQHISENGIINSEQYIQQFNDVCQSHRLKSEMDEFVAAEIDLRQDHEISIYKTENKFKLEAHIFRPEDQSEKKPAVVIFHGGGWSLGSPTWAFKNAIHYRNLGLIGIAGHYRLSNRRDVTPIEAMQDAKDLILWLRRNADSLGIDENRIAAAGWSAGAHLAASTAIFADTLRKETLNSVPDALLLNSPAVDIAQDRWFNKMLHNRKVPAASLSPVESVVKGLPPTLMLQGRDDTVTPLKGTQLFHDKMVEHGNYCELWIYDDVGHLFTPSHLNDRGQPKPDKEIQKQAMNQSDEFLKKIGFISQS